MKAIILNVLPAIPVININLTLVTDAMNTHPAKLPMNIEKKALITSMIAFHAIKVRMKRI